MRDSRQKAQFDQQRLSVVVMKRGNTDVSLAPRVRLLHPAYFQRGKSASPASNTTGSSLFSFLRLSQLTCVMVLFVQMVFCIPSLVFFLSSHLSPSLLLYFSPRLLACRPYVSLVSRRPRPVLALPSRLFGTFFIAHDTKKTQRYYCINLNSPEVNPLCVQCLPPATSGGGLNHCSSCCGAPSMECDLEWSWGAVLATLSVSAVFATCSGILALAEKRRKRKGMSLARAWSIPHGMPVVS